jgi:hypothetical protein
MVAKISFGNSLFGTLAYNGEKINKDEGKLLAANRIFDDGTGKVNIRKALEDFMHFIPDRCRTRNHGDGSPDYVKITFSRLPAAVLPRSASQAH